MGRVLVDIDGDRFRVVGPSREFTGAVKETWLGGRWSQGDYLVPSTWQLMVRLSELANGAEWSAEAVAEADALHHHAVGQAYRANDRAADGDAPDWLSKPQRAGAEWLAKADAALLCDEMGSGKTVMACAALEWIVSDQQEPHPQAFKPPVAALVVCPKAVASVWEDHLHRVAGFAVFALDGPLRKRRAEWEAFVDQPGPKAAVTTWPMVSKLARLEHWAGQERTDAEKTDKELNTIRFDVAVFDEAHRAKDPKAKQTRAAWSIDAGRRWALTGTPVANTPEDFWSMLRLVDPESWSSRAAFTEEFCDLVWGSWGGNVEVAGWREDRMDRLGRMVAPVYRRRSMEECVGRRIDRVREVRYAHLPASHRKQYRAIEDEWRVVAEEATSWSENALTAAARLCQSAASVLDVDGTTGDVTMTGPSPKVTALRELLGDLPPGEPVVVFSASKQLVELAWPALERHKHSCGLLVGGMPRAAQDEAVARWSAGEQQVLLCTYGAASEGITLTRARTVVHLHSGWSSVARMQAEDRVRRWTQEADSVLVVDIVSEDTIDERIQRALADKRDLLDAVSPQELARG